jgi:WD repeat-containing protein 22
MTQAQGTLQHTAEFTAARWHPAMEHLFLTADACGDVCLRDARMTFGSLRVRSGNGVVRRVRGVLLECGRG